MPKISVQTADSTGKKKKKFQDHCATETKSSKKEGSYKKCTNQMRRINREGDLDERGGGVPTKYGG